VETKKPGWLALITLGLLTLPLLYVGAYFALVRPIPPRPAIFAPPRPNTPGYPAAIHSAAVWVFHPIHLADRKLRPKVWGPDW
jgi:hypothetical protein